jgi:uncharacterized protein (DUF2062 family)
VVIAPTYNNDGTLGDVLQRVLDQDIDLIAINDGCTDKTAEILEELAVKVSDPNRFHIETHNPNQGKAAGLITGFKVASQRGYTHAVTIDTDGQHDPEDMHVLLAAARADPYALVIGTRSEKLEGYPAKSLAGRRMSNTFIWLESGVRVEDSQSGYRVYPVGLTQILHCRAGRYGYETEVLTRAAWAGGTIVNEPISMRYLPEDERVSHLHPVKDTLRAVRMHLGLLAIAMLPWARGKCWPPPDMSGASESGAPDEDSPESQGSDPDREKKPSFWKRLWKWISPAEAWRQMRRSRLDQNHLSTGVAVGVFIANLPAYPFQTVIGLYAARRLHLNPISVLLGTYISTPPIGVIMVGLGIGVGHFVLNGKVPTFDELQIETMGFETVSRLFGTLLLEWIVGSMIVGIVMAPLSYIVMRVLFKLVPVKETDA